MKIAVVTGSRSEYGLLKPLLTLLKNDPEIELQLIVCCMHLIKEFGLTFQLIEKDGFCITEKVEMLMANDNPVGITKSMGAAFFSFADVWQRLQPDLVVILGDRFESLAVASSAFVARIPIAHIHGGERSEGALDEGFRHAITKLSHLHFVAAEPYRRRVIQLGEVPERVFNVGAIGLDVIKQLTLMDRVALSQDLPIQFAENNFLVTYHPATLDPTNTENTMNNLFEALNQFPNANVFFTLSNADEGGRLIGSMIEHYTAKNLTKRAAFTSLGSLRYLSLIKQVDMVIGNSSSGLIEVPYFRKPTINIGKRQEGRLKVHSVIDCKETTLAIAAAINKALSYEFQNTLQAIELPYEKENTAQTILSIIKKVRHENLLEKRFYDTENLCYS